MAKKPSEILREAAEIVLSFEEDTANGVFSYEKKFCCPVITNLCSNYNISNEKVMNYLLLVKPDDIEPRDTVWFRYPMSELLSAQKLASTQEWRCMALLLVADIAESEGD